MGIKTLIIDDEPVTRELLKEILAPFGEILAVSSGAKGLSAFIKAIDARKPFNLICLDIMMPEMNGHEVLQQIRTIEKERGLGWSANAKVLMISSLSDEKNIKQAFLKGICDAYLVKPINKFKFVEQLRNLGFSLRSVEL